MRLESLLRGREVAVPQNGSGFVETAKARALENREICGISNLAIRQPEASTI